MQFRDMADISQIPKTLPEHFTILVVDDEEYVRELVGFVLEDVGFVVRYAANGTEASNILDGIDLLVTDLVMPDCEGLETIQTCRRLNPNLKIVAVSGAFEQHYLHAAKILGADAALGKPLDIDLFLDTVHQLLGIEPPKR